MNNNSKREINFYPKSDFYTSGTRKICRFHLTSFLSFSQSLNKCLDCGASLSRPVRFDLCPTNCLVTGDPAAREFRHQPTRH